jgi:hypothetical protein
MIVRALVGFCLAFAVSAACSGDAAEDGICWEAMQAAKPAITTSIMDTWGAPCDSNDQCVALLGEGAICDDQAVIFELPGGFCTKPCTVGDDPQDTDITFELDDLDCDPNGGIACVGANGIYSRCAPPCTGDEQCGREGYFCRQMPQIAAGADPTFCLMDECCENDCIGAP